MTALQGWIVIGLLVSIVLGIIGLGADRIPALRMAYLQSISMISCPPGACLNQFRG